MSGNIDPRFDPHDRQTCWCGGEIRGGGTNSSCESDDSHDPYDPPVEESA